MNNLKKAATVALAIVLFTQSIPGNAAPVKAGGACAKAGLTKVISGKKFSCVKAGKRLVWNKGVLVSAKAKTQTASIANISDLNRTPSSSTISYTWTAPASTEPIEFYELGIAHLIAPGLQEYVSSNYTVRTVFRVVQGSPAIVNVTDLLAYLSSQKQNVSGQLVQISVRAVTSKQTSNWSNYTSVGQVNLLKYLDSVATPTPIAPTPEVPAPSAPDLEMPREPDAPTQPINPNPTPTPTVPAVNNPGTYTTATYKGFNSIRCPSDSTYVASGLGTIPQPKWYSTGSQNGLYGTYPAEWVTVYSANISTFFGTATASGRATTYLKQSTGGYLAPNGQRYYVFSTGSWSIPVWITCGKMTY